MTRKAAPAGLFVGLCTLDAISSVRRLPQPNEKVTALAQTVSAGGPATNAAVAFSHLGGQASLLTGVGAHPLAAGIRADLEHTGVRLIDAARDDPAPPAVSAVMVTAGSSDRAVVSPNATGRLLEPPADLEDLVAGHDVVLVDGHHHRLARATLATARRLAAITILDGGSWKPGTAELLADVDAAVCSADFHPPGTRTHTADVLTFLHAAGVAWAAVTHGAEPIMWAGPSGQRGIVPVPAVTVVDTLGAGDVFHGALAHALATAGRLDRATFPDALEQAATHAAASCRSFGTRSWMDAAGTTGPPARRPGRTVHPS